MKARELANHVLREMKRTGEWAMIPTIDKKWLLRWKRDKGVVFRKPNQRWKVSRKKLLERLRLMWLNVVRVRRFAERTWGRDLATEIWGIDEKPIH